MDDPARELRRYRGRVFRELWNPLCSSQLDFIIRAEDSAPSWELLAQGGALLRDQAMLEHAVTVQQQQLGSTRELLCRIRRRAECLRAKTDAILRQATPYSQ